MNLKMIAGGVENCQCEKCKASGQSKIVSLAFVFQTDAEAVFMAEALKDGSKVAKFLEDVGLFEKSNQTRH